MKRQAPRHPIRSMDISMNKPLAKGIIQEVFHSLQALSIPEVALAGYCNGVFSVASTISLQARLLSALLCRHQHREDLVETPHEHIFYQHSTVFND